MTFKLNWKTAIYETGLNQSCFFADFETEKEKRTLNLMTFFVIILSCCLIVIHLRLQKCLRNISYLKIVANSNKQLILSPTILDILIIQLSGYHCSGDHKCSSKKQAMITLRGIEEHRFSFTM